MTPAQKERRAQLEETLGRPDPKAIEKGMCALLMTLVPHVDPTKGLLLHSDDHRAYRRALRRLGREQSHRSVIVHRITSSRERRTQSNPRFPINLTDLLARHGSANHRREAIAFSKRRQAALERAAIFTVWRNCVEKRRENGPAESAAMRIGLLNRLLTWPQVLRRRLFPALGGLPPEWRAYYWRKVKTAAFGQGQTHHACRYAF